MKSIKLAIIGVGKIGRYHLQSLKNIDREISIEVVDPSYNSLECINKKDLNTEKIKEIKLIQDISFLSDQLDLVIVATNSDVRYLVVKELLKLKNVRYLILEKILFQKEEYYSEINELLKKNDVKAWINCPLRTLAFYKEIKRLLGNFSKIDYYVSCSNLNLGSNAIHHLDLFVYLTGQNNLKIDSNYLDEEILSSKRKNFIEFSGTLLGSTFDGSRIVITSYSRGAVPPIIEINSEKLRCLIDVNGNKALMSFQANNYIWEEVKYVQPKQSEITYLLVQQILDTGESELTTFYDSWKIHSSLIKSLMQHLQKKAIDEVILCPIT